jgi:regulatory protein
LAGSFNRDADKHYGSLIRKGFSVPVVTAIEVQKRNKERVNVYLDGKYAFSLNLMDAMRLKRGQDLTDAEITAMQGDDAVVRAVESASRFLGHRPRSVSEVYKNLKGKDFEPAIVDLAIERLTGMGYLDDSAFARYWIESRERFKPLGRIALRFELRQKGVADAVIETALEALDDEDSAYRAAASLLKRQRGYTVRVARQKLSSALARRGFPFSEIRAALDRHFEEADPDFFVANDAESYEDEP